MAPKLADVRKSYEKGFPSLLGVRLANRVKEDVFRDMMTKIKAAQDLEPGRREALIAQYSNQLRSQPLMLKTRMPKAPLSEHPPRNFMTLFPDNLWLCADKRSFEGGTVVVERL